MSAVRRLRKSIRSALERAGIEAIPVASLRNPLERRRRLLDHLGVDLVIDVGANRGQYGLELRRIGYRGEILSFEPLLDPFGELSQHANADARWHAIQSAIGPSPGRSTLNVAANGGASSSFLAMLVEVTANAPDATYAGAESVDVRRLDEAGGEAVSRATATLLKADVQGYELEVLDSATDVLPRIVGLQLEMSLVRLYEGAPSFIAMLETTQDLGFRLVGIEPGFTATDGRLLQVDGLFDRPGNRP